MNWYLETELCHVTAEWDILKEGLLLAFSFEDGFTSSMKPYKRLRQLSSEHHKNLWSGSNQIGAPSCAMCWNVIM